MITVSVTEFKTHCLRLMEQAHVSGETIEIVKRGRPFATVVPTRAKSAYLPGQFKDIVKIAGEIEVDSEDLGIDWEALRSIHCRHFISGVGTPRHDGFPVA